MRVGICESQEDGVDAKEEGVPSPCRRTGVTVSTAVAYVRLNRGSARLQPVHARRAIRGCNMMLSADAKGLFCRPRDLSTGRALVTSFRKLASAAPLMSNAVTVRPWARNRAAQDAPIEPHPMMEMCWIEGVVESGIV